MALRRYHENHITLLLMVLLNVPQHGILERATTAYYWTYHNSVLLSVPQQRIIERTTQACYWTCHSCVLLNVPYLCINERTIPAYYEPYYISILLWNHEKAPSQFMKLNCWLGIWAKYPTLFYTHLSLESHTYK